ncbi:MAG: glycine zipper family protein [Steroidobacteraceae bacterium]
MNKQTLPVLLAVAALSACAAAPVSGPRLAGAPAAPPVNLTKVYFYPSQGQSEEQQDRDRYECHSWGVRETGFDPSQHLAPGTERGSVVPARSSGETIGTGAVLGAVIGAIAAGRGDTAKGAVVGAMAGTALGSAAASANEAEARRVEQSSSYRGFRRYEKQAGEFRRAMSACLEGRGYSVK